MALADVSYNVKPTKAVILRSIKIPPVGGDTMFANMELAWETLDKNIKEKIKDKKAIHSSLGGAFFTDEYEAMESNGNMLNIQMNIQLFVHILKQEKKYYLLIGLIPKK